MIEEIRNVLRDHSGLGSAVDGLADHADLYSAGMTSHASVNVMLGLENQFDIEFPDHLLKRSSFESMAAIRGAIESLAVDLPAT